MQKHLQLTASWPPASSPYTLMLLTLTLTHAIIRLGLCYSPPQERLVLMDWTFIGVFLLIAALLPVAPIVLTMLFGPHKANPSKNSTYECGVETVGETWVQFRAQYYLFALVFVVFDVETVFLFPFAAAYDQIGLWAVGEAVLFILILVAGLVYVWRKGALEWS